MVGKKEEEELDAHLCGWDLTRGGSQLRLLAHQASACFEINYLKLLRENRRANQPDTARFNQQNRFGPTSLDQSEHLHEHAAAVVWYTHETTPSPPVARVLWFFC